MSGLGPAVGAGTWFRPPRVESVGSAGAEPGNREGGCLTG